MQLLAPMITLRASNSPENYAFSQLPTTTQHELSPTPWNFVHAILFKQILLMTTPYDKVRDLQLWLSPAGWQISHSCISHITHTHTALRDRRDSSLSVGVRTAKAAERRASKNSLHKLKRNSDMPSSNEDLSES